MELFRDARRYVTVVVHQGLVTIGAALIIWGSLVTAAMYPHLYIYLLAEEVMVIHFVCPDVWRRRCW